MTSSFRNKMMMSAGALAALGVVGCGPMDELAGGGASSLEPSIAPSDPTEPAGPDEPGDLSNTVTVRGVVQDPNSIPIAGVRVATWSGWETFTDANGRYDLPDVEDGVEVDLILTRDGYASSFDTVRGMVGGQNYFQQTLAPVDLSTEFSAATGTAFTLDDTHTFTVPGGSMETESGAPYDGVVSMNATVFDRKTPLDEGGELRAVPGNGYWRTAGGDGRVLFSAGAFQLEFTDAAGNVLHAGPGLEILVELPPNMGANIGDDIQFRSFDPLQNNWGLEDEANIVQFEDGVQAVEFTLTGGLPDPPPGTRFMTGTICHPETVVETATTGGTVTDPQGNPKPNVPVRVIAADQTFMVATRTDANGVWSAQVPPEVQIPVGPNGRPMFIEVDYEVLDKPSVWREDARNAPFPDQHLNWGQSKLGALTCLAGQVLDPSGEPMADVPVLNPHGGNSVSDAEGNFCMNVPTWQPMTVYTTSGISSELGFEPRRARPAPTVDGSCQAACPNQVTLRAYPATQCVQGEVYVDGFAGDNVAVETFDARFPATPVFSTLTNGGSYCAVVPANVKTTVRVGVSDSVDANSCGSFTTTAIQDEYAQCDSGWCQEAPVFDCNE